MPWTQLGPASEPAPPADTLDPYRKANRERYARRVGGETADLELSPPAGRGDATQPDSAMIERATKAKALELIKAALSFLAANGKTIERDPWQLAAAAYEAAAGVIVAATAEAIAVEFEDWSETATWLTSDTCRAVANMIRSLDFGAGLSAGATGGDGDD